MGFRINTNIAAMNAHTNATMNNRNLDSSLGKLSSGLRINTAADDASGLSIANSLRAQASSLGQAISNGNDAIGLIQTADGALSEYSNILDTIKTKTVQAASDTQNTASRLAIQKDIDALMEELNIIATTTSFNGQKLLSGAFTNKEFQMGANANESVKTSIASTETQKIGHTTRSDLNLSGVGEVQLNLVSNHSGESVALKSVDIQYNNNQKNGVGALADVINGSSGETGITAVAIVEATSSTSINAGTTGSDFAINGVNIGAIVVEDNDNSGTLLSAINKVTVETGVTGTLNTDGSLTLTSDGRALQVTGGITDVTGSAAQDLTTVGYIELVQAGASEFQVVGVGAGATGMNVTADGNVVTVKDSILAAGSIIVASSTFKAGTVIGGDVTTTAGSAVATTLDTTLKAGSILATASSIERGSTIGGVVINAANETLEEDMFITAGSTLEAGTVLGAGTVIQQDFTNSSINYTAGQTLSSAVTLAGSALTLTADMTVNYVTDGSTQSLVFASSTINVGSTAASDIVTSGTTTIVEDSTLKAGSLIVSSSVLKAGSTLGGDTLTDGAITTSRATELKAGSTLIDHTELAKGSTVGGEITLNATATLTEDMSLKAGSTIASGTLIKAGTVIQQDLTSTQAGAASGAIAAGTQLTSDITTGGDITLSEDMTLLKGDGTAGNLLLGSKIAINTENSGSVGISNTEYQALSDIDVTTLEGAMKAMDTVSAAITDLDTIRSGLGSVQNQVVSTINNISVTQVNVKAAESNLRDVDFAAESANFSKFNILAQSGSYAMSQANAVQQNVMRLLQ